jgi:glycosyltransferase involved in cell wall biosynthesis
MQWSARTIYHLTYGEEQYGLLGKTGWPHRCKVVATFHQPPEILSGAFRNHDALRRLDGAIAVASNQLDLLHELVGPDRVLQIPHGVETGYWKPDPAPRPPSARRTVLSVGHWLRDLDTLETVVRDLQGTLGENLEFVAVTSAEHADRLKRWPGTRVLTGISEAALRQWYRIADVTLLPLSDGTVNNAMLESMACGTPVVVTNLGAVRDLSPDGLGLVTVPAHDASAMTQAALSVLEDPDSEQRARSARRHAEKLDWSRVARDLLDAYCRIAAGP